MANAPLQRIWRDGYSIGTRLEKGYWMRCIWVKFRICPIVGYSEQRIPEFLTRSVNNPFSETICSPVQLIFSDFRILHAGTIAIVFVICYVNPGNEIASSTVHLKSQVLFTTSSTLTKFWNCESLEMLQARSLSCLCSHCSVNNLLFDKNEDGIW